MGMNLVLDQSHPSKDEFGFVEIAGNSKNGRFWRNKLMRIENFYRQPIPNSQERFVSIFRFNLSEMSALSEARRQNKAYLIGDLYFDLDNPFPAKETAGALLLQDTPFDDITSFEEGLQRCQHESLYLIEKLMNYGIPEEAIHAFFSGRGIHLQVDSRVFGARPSTDLHIIFRQIAFKLAEVDTKRSKIPLQLSPNGQAVKQAYPATVQTMDQDFYNSARLIRTPNSINLKAGRYKIHLSINELEDCTPSEIIGFALTPRPLPSRPQVDISPQARRLFIKSWQILRKKQHTANHPEIQLIRRGYDLIFLDQNGQTMKGELPQDIAQTARELAKKFNSQVVLAIKKA